MSTIWLTTPAATPLARYRVLSPLAGIRVSPLQVGAVGIGDQWEKLGFGAVDKQSSFKLLDAYYEAGGNFIDTASTYRKSTTSFDALLWCSQDGSSKKFIGEWMERKRIRDQLVIATKASVFAWPWKPIQFMMWRYSTNFESTAKDIATKVNYAGNNVKSLFISVEESLRNLRTTYINMLYIHWWDRRASIEEVVDNLHHLVAARKVLFRTHQRGSSRTRTLREVAWEGTIRNLSRQVEYPGPQFRAGDHTDGSYTWPCPCPWNVLSGGCLRTDAEEEKRLTSGKNGRSLRGEDWRRNEDERKIGTALEKVAKEVGVDHITAVAIAYAMQKTPCVPRRRWAKGRASPGKYRGTQDFALGWANTVP